MDTPDIDDLMAAFSVAGGAVVTALAAQIARQTVEIKRLHKDAGDFMSHLRQKDGQLKDAEAMKELWYKQYLVKQQELDQVKKNLSAQDSWEIRDLKSMLRQAIDAGQLAELVADSIEKNADFAFQCYHEMCEKAKQLQKFITDAGLEAPDVFIPDTTPPDEVAEREEIHQNLMRIMKKLRDFELEPSSEKTGKDGEGQEAKDDLNDIVDNIPF